MAKLAIFNFRALLINRSAQLSGLAVLLTCLIFLLPYERIPSFLVGFGGVEFDLRLSFLAGGALIILVGLALYHKNLSIKQLNQPLYWLLAGFLSVYFLAVLASRNMGRAMTVWLFTCFTVGVGVAVSLAWQYREKVQFDQALKVTTWVVLVFGFYQYFGDLLGLPSTWTGLRDIYTSEIFGVPRIQSTGLEPLYYANFLLIPFFYFVAQFVLGRDKQPHLIATIAAQLVMTLSRGALYAGLVGLLLLLVLMYQRAIKSNMVRFVAVVLVGIVVGFSFSALPNLKTSEGEPQRNTTESVVRQATNLDSQDDRVRNRAFAWQAFQANPLLGIGPGNFNDYAKERYKGYQDEKWYVIVNNEPLELLAEGGIVPFTLIAAFAVLLMWRLIKQTWQDKGQVIWAYGITAYLLALLIQYQAFSTLYIMHVWVAIGIALGVVTTRQPATK